MKEVIKPNLKANTHQLIFAIIRDSPVDAPETANAVSQGRFFREPRD